jgi:hypothetical protein
MNAWLPRSLAQWLTLLVGRRQPPSFNRHPRESGDPVSLFVGARRRATGGQQAGSYILCNVTSWP